MDIYTSIRKNLAWIGKVTDIIVISQSDAERKELFDALAIEMTAHRHMANATLYHALRREKSVREILRRAEKLHDEIAAYVASLARLPVDSERWIEQFGEFRHCIMTLAKEENALAQYARKALSPAQAQELASRMELLKQKQFRKVA